MSANKRQMSRCFMVARGSVTSTWPSASISSECDSVSRPSTQLPCTGDEATLQGPAMHAQGLLDAAGRLCPQMFGTCAIVFRSKQPNSRDGCSPQAPPLQTGPPAPGECTSLPLPLRRRCLRVAAGYASAHLTETAIFHTDSCVYLRALLWPTWPKARMSS